MKEKCNDKKPGGAMKDDPSGKKAKGLKKERAAARGKKRRM